MVFCFVQKFLFEQHKSSNIYFFCRAKREIFFQNITLGYMTKTLNHIIREQVTFNDMVMMSTLCGPTMATLKPIILISNQPIFALTH
jgi:tryptophanase